MNLPSQVRIVEVGPRDGLQNERATIPTGTKLGFLERLARTGLREIEFGSFVSPRWIPRLADSPELAARLPQSRPEIIWTALVPNQRGMERALAAGVRSVAVFTAASETFNRKNINAGIDESFERFRPVVEMARAAGVRVRGYVSTAFVCPYEGPIEPERAVAVSARLLAAGAVEVSVGDTIGAAGPRQVEEFLRAADSSLDPARVAFHFHDTRGTALANVLVALQSGYRAFDASAGGLGGCPYAPGAGGNLATEDLVHFLHGLGIATGVDLDAVVEASRFIEKQIGHPLPSKVYRAVLGARAPA